MGETLNKTLTDEIQKSISDATERSELEETLKQWNLSDSEQIRLAEALSKNEKPKIEAIMKPIFLKIQETVAGSKTLPWDATLQLSSSLFPKETYSAFVKRSDTPNQDMSEAFDAILKPGATPTKADYQKVSSTIDTMMKQGEPMTRGNLRKITEVVDKLPDIQEKNQIEKTYPTIAKGLVENGYPINNQADIDFLAKLDPKMVEEIQGSIPKSWKPCLLQYINNRYEISDVAGPMNVKALKKLGTITNKSEEKPMSTSTSADSLEKQAAAQTPPAPTDKISSTPQSIDVANKNAKDQVQSAAEAAPQDVKDQVSTATAGLQNPSETGNSEKDAQDAVNNLLNSDNPLAKMFGNVLKALLGAMGMYKSEETADAATDVTKESSPENRVQKIDEMVKKGEESKTYFPAKISEKGLEDIPPVDPKNQKSADAADKAKAERTTYILDTRKALGLPIDKTEKNVYDAEVMAKVKEIQKKAGLTATGLFNKETAEAYQKSIKTETSAEAEKTPESKKDGVPHTPENEKWSPEVNSVAKEIITQGKEMEARIKTNGRLGYQKSIPLIEAYLQNNGTRLNNLTKEKSSLDPTIKTEILGQLQKVSREFLIPVSESRMAAADAKQKVAPLLQRVSALEKGLS